MPTGKPTSPQNAYSNDYKCVTTAGIKCSPWCQPRIGGTTAGKTYRGNLSQNVLTKTVSQGYKILYVLFPKDIIYR